MRDLPPAAASLGMCWALCARHGGCWGRGFMCRCAHLSIYMVSLKLQLHVWYKYACVCMCGHMCVHVCARALTA